MRPDRLRLRDVRNTSTFRLTLWLGLVFAIGYAALIGLIYTLSATELTVRTDRILRREAAVLSAASADALPQRVETELAHNISGLTYIALQSGDGEVIAGNLHVAADFPIGSLVNVPGSPGHHPPVRVLAIRAPTTGETILIGRDITPILDLRHRVTVMLVVSGLAIAILVLVAAVALSRPPLRRVQRLQHVSREIAAGRFDLRMPVSRRGDELDLFAATVNAMIEELGRVVAQVKEVTDAVAHDLRTPLARARAQFGRLHAAAEGHPDLAAMAGGGIAELDRVLDRFAALLRISELEARGRQARFEPIVLAPLLTDLCELYEPLAEDGGVALNCRTGEAPAIRGDRQLLFEAVSNLIDNAVKFSPAGGTVAVRSFTKGDQAVIEVVDDGPGVPVEEREAVLRRFHRGTGTGETPGTGLGLSIVAAIVHLHGFTLVLDDAAPGLVVRIVCPAASAA